MSDELYHEAILDQARRATGAGRLEHAQGSGTADNPLCGDRVTMDVRLDDHRIAALGHEVRGCLLCEAAASAIGDAAPGQRREDIAGVVAELTRMLKQDGPPPGGAWSGLAVFAPVRRYKSRHDCVLLAFDALDRALAEAERAAGA